MTEDNNNQTDQHTEEQQSPDETQTELRAISKEELLNVLEDHEEWLPYAPTIVSRKSRGGLPSATLEEKECPNDIILKRANLSRTNLKKAYLMEANLQWGYFNKANLQEAMLVDSNLQNATLTEVNLQKTFLSGANLQEADLDEANLQEAILYCANLKSATIRKANLQKANLAEANLQGADLRKANLQQAYLNKANLQKAELDKANLQGADLRKANLQEAYLITVNLQKTYLNEANLQQADLSEANLQEANLSKADMQNTVLDGVKGLNTANLKYTNLESATGLLGNEFSQADVTGAKLPDDIKDFKALETVEKTSQNARKIFFTMLLGCFYSWLTIATTTDVRLLTNTASSPLPIIGTQIPIAWFYIAAPLVIICLYFYFHLYLDNLWGALASLPAIFPDGKRLDERAYPWLLNTLVRRHCKRLKSRPLMARMKEWITIFLAWCVVPFTMMAFWLRYIPRHDWFGTIFHILMILLSIGFGIVFYRMCALTLTRKKKSVFRFLNFWRDRRFYYGVSVVTIAVIFSLLSYGAIKGVRTEWSPGYGPSRGKEIDIYSITEITPRIFDKVGYDVFADFREKNVSEKPNNYWEIKEDERIESVKGANLKNMKLENAYMIRAFLVKADLRSAKLKNAFLANANLQKADFKFAHLIEADLHRANLRDADLRYTNLQGASFNFADLKNASLYMADLREAFFPDADLKNADIGRANLMCAYLKGVKNLTIEQLSKVETLYKVQLDPELMEQVKKCCPHLLEKPKEKTDKTN